MSFKISLSDDGTHVRIQVFEDVTGTLEKDFAEKAIEEANKHSINKFLVDVRAVRNVAGIVDQYTFGYEDLRSFALDRTSRIAILVDAGDESHNFIETVLRNAGLTTSLFMDEDHALKWLAGQNLLDRSRLCFGENVAHRQTSGRNQRCNVSINMLRK